MISEREPVLDGVFTLRTCPGWGIYPPHLSWMGYLSSAPVLDAVFILEGVTDAGMAEASDAGLVGVVLAGEIRPTIAESAGAVAKALANTVVEANGLSRESSTDIVVGPELESSRDRGRAALDWENALPRTGESKTAFFPSPVAPAAMAERYWPTAALGDLIQMGQTTSFMTHTEHSTSTHACTE